jgi:hypothetical protein
MEALITQTYLISRHINGHYVHDCRLTLTPKSIEIFGQLVLLQFQKEIREGEYKLLEDGRTYYHFKVGAELGDQLRTVLREAMALC